MAEILGLEVEDLPDSQRFMVTSAVVVIEAVDLEVEDPARARTLTTRVAGGIPIWQAIGMLECMLSDLRESWRVNVEEAGE